MLFEPLRKYSLEEIEQIAGKRPVKVKMSYATVWSVMDADSVQYDFHLVPYEDGDGWILVAVDFLVPKQEPWQLGKDLTPSHGWWWVAMPTWKYPTVAYMAKLGDGPWKVAEPGMNPMEIDPGVLYKKIPSEAMPGPGEPVFDEAMKMVFGNSEEEA
jgi:hypothetical protein